MKIEDYFVSDSFYNALIPLYGKVKKEKIARILEFIVGSVIQYVSINNFSMDGVESFVNKLVTRISENPDKCCELGRHEIRDYTNDLVYEVVLKRMGITEDDLKDFDIEKEYILYVIDKCRRNEIWYHAFNGVFLDSILEHGLNSNMSFTSQKDLDMIHNIFKKYNIDMALGWQQINCKGKVSYSLSPGVSYSYGNASPEWFSQFCGGGGAFYSIPNRVQYAFRDNDYEGAKNNLLQVFKARNFSEADQNIVLTFFERNWKLYANRDVYVVAIPHIDTSIDEDVLLKRARSLEITPRQFFDINYCEHGIDMQTDDVVSVSNAKFIKLPDYSKVEKLLNFDDIKSKLEILKNSAIGVKEQNGRKILYSMHGEEELKKVKEILCDNDVFNYILNNPMDGYYNYKAWIPYFSNSILSIDENIVGIYKNARTYFGYVSDDKRNNPELMKACLVGSDSVDKYTLHFVGESVLDNIEFMSLYLIKLKDEDFDFYAAGECSIDGSKMAYGKLIGKKVQTDPKFWELLNSKIKMINKKFNLDISLFDVNREMVIASRYFDGKKEKN